MYKIGVDMTTVSRIEKSCEKPTFLAHVFTQRELDAFYHRDKPKFASLAANFAAKEAFSKALGTAPCANFFMHISQLQQYYSSAFKQKQQVFTCCCFYFLSLSLSNRSFRVLKKPLRCS